MLFNTLTFWAFFAIVLVLFYASPRSWRKPLLLVASYTFYGMWDWRFLSLIAISTAVDFICAKLIAASDNDTNRRRFVVLSISVNLGILGFFKYFNLFAEHTVVGISFYTFQTMSYTIDVYRRITQPTNSILDFANFVAFFPQLVAGPIERAHHLLPQLGVLKNATPHQALEGVTLILVGLFYKVYVADNLAVTVDAVYGKQGLPGSYYLVATYAFAFQILGDFAGYSSIARGLAKCLGVDLMVNFHAPYFATGPREFWRRWHISLSCWLRDYLYIPLGGSHRSRVLTLRNLMITMLLGGLWHGAAWTFVAWGFIHAVMLIGEHGINKMRFDASRVPAVIKMVIFFHLVCVTWVFFRAQSIDGAFHILHSIVWRFDLSATFWILVIDLVRFAGPLLLLQYLEYRRKNPDWLSQTQWAPQGLIYAALILLMIIFGVTGGNEFIYFQF
jgi:D-alanyl-lipoteichoic acid acyltransferase DltB (MBOAT superfamily)